MSLQSLRIDRSWTLFLDRDGVINRRIPGGYVRNCEEFEFLPGTLDAIAKFSALFGRIIIVSNQQGVGKGVMTDADVHSVHNRMKGEIEVSGGRIDAIFYAPQLESSGSFMRKPKPGMAISARDQFPEILFERSLMVGDSMGDMQFGKEVGMKTVMISAEASVSGQYQHLVDFIFPDLLSLAGSI